MADELTCGPNDWVDIVPDLIFNECCARHDLDYRRGGNELDREIADNRFLQCLLDEADESMLSVLPFGLNPFEQVAHLYGNTVKLFGSKFFNYREEKKFSGVKINKQNEKESTMSKFEEMLSNAESTLQQLTQEQKDRKKILLTVMSTIAAAADSGIITPISMAGAIEASADLIKDTAIRGAFQAIFSGFSSKEIEEQTKEDLGLGSLTTPGASGVSTNQRAQNDQQVLQTLFGQNQTGVPGVTLTSGQTEQVSVDQALAQDFPDIDQLEAQIGSAISQGITQLPIFDATVTDATVTDATVT